MEEQHGERWGRNNSIYPDISQGGSVFILKIILILMLFSPNILAFEIQTQEQVKYKFKEECHSGNFYIARYECVHYGMSYKQGVFCIRWELESLQPVYNTDKEHKNCSWWGSY